MSETTDEFITAAWIVGAPVVAAGKWAGRKAYRGAQVAGMAYQNWRYGAGGQDGSSAPAATTSSSAPAGTCGGKWSTIEQHEETTMTYHHESSTKWTK